MGVRPRGIAIFSKSATSNSHRILPNMLQLSNNETILVRLFVQPSLGNMCCAMHGTSYSTTRSASVIGNIRSASERCCHWHRRQPALRVAGPAAISDMHVVRVSEIVTAVSHVAIDRTGRLWAHHVSVNGVHSSYVLRVRLYRRESGDLVHARRALPASVPIVATAAPTNAN